MCWIQSADYHIINGSDHNFAGLMSAVMPDNPFMDTGAFLNENKMLMPVLLLFRFSSSKHRWFSATTERTIVTMGE